MTESKNYFSFSSSVHDLLFKDVTVSSKEGIFGLCVGVAVFTFLYEAIKALRHYLVILQMQRRDNPNFILPERNGSSRHNLFSWLNSSSQKTFENRLIGSQINFSLLQTDAENSASGLKFHCLQTVLHMLQLTMGYMLMLIIMSYNAWFFVTVIVVTALCFYFHEFVLSRKSMILPVEIPGSSL